MRRDEEKFDYTTLLSEMHYFIDFEASGLHPESYPIEVGVYGAPGDLYESLIKPARNWDYWSYDAQDVHKIERPTLFEQGSQVEEVVRQLNERFAGKVLWADSHYDAMWMAILLEAAGCEPTFKVGNIYLLFPESKWGQFRRFLPSVIKHRALQDAFDIKQAWEKFVMSEIQAKNR